ncbi:MAG: CotH kinase family protein [Planctomycetes bacterium]|nr:CotH kinase family protein [Planctomycetota bacterium]
MRSFRRGGGAWTAAGVALGLVAAPAASRGTVVISEVHYNPPQGAALEFVELQNLDAQPVPIAGWRFSDGIQFIFPEGAVIDGNGFVVVCQNREVLSARFGLPPAAVHGDYVGSLDNGGETIVLEDSSGVVVDQVKYDDDAPWDADADGAGPSLERVCGSFDPEHPGNWSAEAGAEPSPLQRSRLERCPPPSIPPPRVTIHEVHYHPLNDRDAEEEFVELRNNAAEPVNLKGYAFASGIDFTFQEDAVLEPGGLIVVCRDAAHMRTVYGLANAVGDFLGQLSNDGERLSLVDPSGALVDSVRYSDHGEWPVAADGLGRSLEKVVATAVSDDPASWKEAGIGDLSIWRRVTVSGVASSSKLIVYLNGVGEVLVDNVSIADPANLGQSLLPNGTFDAGLEPWLVKGNHADTAWDAAGGPDGSGAMRIISNGAGSGTAQGISVDCVPALVRNATYVLSFDFKHLTGARGLLFRLSGATSSRGIYWQLAAGSVFTPGAPNTVEASGVPPLVSRLGRFPREPGSADAVGISARVRAAEPLALVKLTYTVNGAGEAASVEMLDDGQHQDAGAGDGTYGALVPAQPHNTIVVFRVEATDAKGAVTLSPPETDPTGHHAYYVNDLRPGSPFPVYTLLLRHTTATAPRSILAGLNCQTYQVGSFAYQGDVYYNIGIRQRGQSVCGSTKPFLKVRFQRGRDFEGLHKLNLQSLWTDKSLVREKMAWEVFRDVGMPDCFEYYVRLQVNGKYFGLYGALEHPDARFLERNRLNPEGNLYKATASTEEVTGTYEKKTNEDNDYSDLRTFLQTMHGTARPQLRAFFEQNVDEDRMIDYQLAQTLTNNSDYPHKNHYLYHDTEKGRWIPLTWDMDLTFGKIWDGTYGGVLHDKMHNPGNNPWYTTSVDGGLGNHLLDKFFSQAGDWYRRAYIVRLWDALVEKYTEAFFNEKIAFLHDVLFDEQAEDIAVWSRSAATADDPRAPKELEPNLDRVKEHIRVRRAYLVNYLKTRSRFNGHDRLKITEVMYNPEGSAEDLEFLELWNPDAAEIDVSRWSVEGLGYAFPEGTKVAPNEIFVLAKDTVALRAKHGEGLRALGPYEGNLDNDGEILRVKDAGPGYPATVDFLRYGRDDGWPREADGLGYSIELTLVAPDRDNDLGVYWARSREPGGSPGAIAGLTPGLPLFRRGDIDADGKVSITDAIVLLRHLFLGGPEPGCLASGDSDADGQLGLTDAVRILDYLFRDSALAFPPPGPKECAPGDPAVCKLSNCRA